MWQNSYGFEAIRCLLATLQISDGSCFLSSRFSTQDKLLNPFSVKLSYLNTKGECCHVSSVVYCLTSDDFQFNANNEHAPKMLSAQAYPCVNFRLWRCVYGCLCLGPIHRHRFVCLLQGIVVSPAKKTISYFRFQFSLKSDTNSWIHPFRVHVRCRISIVCTFVSDASAISPFGISIFIFI